MGREGIGFSPRGRGHQLIDSRGIFFHIGSSGIYT